MKLPKTANCMPMEYVFPSLCRGRRDLRKNKMSKTSPLGAAIEAIVDGDKRFTRERDPVKYLCCYETDAGNVFAFERTTIN
jgi:hypothetical protein